MYCSTILTAAKPAGPPRPTGGCGNCWAAGYCAAYSPASTQVPANCPLGITSEPANVPPLPPVRGTVAPETSPTLSSAKRPCRISAKLTLV
ncbi:hypothetical protein [Hymenobacter arcticus]